MLFTQTFYTSCMAIKPLHDYKVALVRPRYVDDARWDEFSISMIYRHCMIFNYTTPAYCIRKLMVLEETVKYGIFSI